MIGLIGCPERNNFTNFNIKLIFKLPSMALRKCRPNPTLKAKHGRHIRKATRWRSYKKNKK